MKSRIFVASSAEHVELAHAAQEELEHDAEVTVWSQGVFSLSRTAMASLIDQLNETDFAIFILAPSDVATVRESSVNVVRDNVIFELGLFAGRIGPNRCYLIVPRGNEELHLPTDLLGLTPALYEPDRQDKNMVAALGPACSRIRRSMNQLGPINKVEIAAASEIEPKQNELHEDENDCISIIESWMGRQSSGSNTRAIHFADVDRMLRLAPGSARKYLKTVGIRWGYSVAREGKATILFKDR